MLNIIVVVANGSRARFFSLQNAETPEYESSPRMVEHETLVNPEQAAAGKDLWTDTRSGSNRGGGGGGVHRYDDHREQHRVEYERRFVQSVAGETAALARTAGAVRVVVTADNRMLGMLRGELHRNNGFELKEVAKDYSKFSVHELHEQLASMNLIPARRKPGFQ
ncbi:MAG TPA: host attachment protein [Methylophilaceae bacterium]|jgi:protein required for attachment to host cells|nr:host attachment protein [Methylophilaceae bacterium]